MLHAIWLANKYLIGSTTKTIPYELVYALTTALADWSNSNNLVTTALTDDFNFYLQGIDPDFKRLVKSYLNIDISYDLIQIALPKLYIHKPLYSIPLYHELGHFVDNEKRIASASMLLFNVVPGVNLNIELSHRREYFADLFAISYTGEAAIIFLSEFASDAPDSMTHPSTVKRIEVMKAFLEEKSHVVIDIFNATIKHLGLPSLVKRYQIPDIDSSFNNIRPYSIANKEELHGMMTAAWTHLLNLSTNSSSSLKEITDEFEPARIINDLTEKSIRNMILREKWENGNTQ